MNESAEEMEIFEDKSDNDDVMVITPEVETIEVLDSDDDVEMRNTTNNEITKEGPECDETSPDSHVVEKVLGHRIRNRKTEYLIKWKDFPQKENSWEPSEHLNEKLILKNSPNCIPKPKFKRVSFSNDLNVREFKRDEFETDELETEMNESAEEMEIFEDKSDNDDVMVITPEVETIEVLDSDDDVEMRNTTNNEITKEGPECDETSPDSHVVEKVLGHR
ncbi:Chromobox protein like 3, partial [Pseudolycoriella hygida]